MGVMPLCVRSDSAVRPVGHRNHTPYQTRTVFQVVTAKEQRHSLDPARQALPRVSAPAEAGALRLELIANAADERERPPRALVVDVVEAGTYEVIHF